jgi:ferredoxin
MSAPDKPRGRRSRSGQRLRVDPVACDGIGQCAMAASSIIHLDRWGYPVVPTTELSVADVGQAKRAIKACPRQALWLEAVD